MKARTRDKLGAAETVVLATVLALGVLLPAVRCGGQEIEPRRWSHLPVGGNYAGAAYSYTFGDISLDPELRIQNANFEMQAVTARYTRSFELLGKSAHVDVIQPYQIGHWRGLLNGTPAKADRSGFGDPSLRFAVNRVGAPPLAGKEFAEYRQETDTETIVGVGLITQFPAGQYYKDKLINLGSNRFAFRSQLGVVHNRGNWSLELTTTTSFFTDNDDFFNGKHLEQDPLYTLDAHAIYTFRPGLWISASAGYGIGGETAVNGRANNNTQSNLAWGVALGIPITRDVGVKLAYIGTSTLVRTGLESQTFLCVVSVSW